MLRMCRLGEKYPIERRETLIHRCEGCPIPNEIPCCITHVCLISQGLMLTEVERIEVFSSRTDNSNPRQSKKFMRILVQYSLFHNSLDCNVDNSLKSLYFKHNDNIKRYFSTYVNANMTCTIVFLMIIQIAQPHQEYSKTLNNQKAYN